MNSFNATFTPNVMYGRPVHEALCDLSIAHNVNSILIVTDSTIVELGLLDQSVAKIKSHGINVNVFSDVEADPSYETVLRAADLGRHVQSGLVIGFGGGSSLDVAKLVSVLIHPDCNQALDKMFGVDQITSPRIDLILVPTTAGTGSEATPISIVTTGKTTKAGIVSPTLLPDHAVLDPKLTTGLPANVTAATGVDAMVHAIEAYTSKIKKNPISDVLACKALILLSNNIRTVVFDGKNIEARGAMLLGSMLAGQAFANAPVGGVHALAYPLGGHFHIPHGLSNALMLPHVMRFNLSHAVKHYAELANIVCPKNKLGDDEESNANALIEYLVGLINEVALPDQLRQCGIAEEDLPLLASEAMLQQRLLVNNPRELNEADALRLYKQAF
ncbi:iron-containing alcohol dehydrogenase [Aliiglaciecola sp. M165]|uniref:iron-containing alcohol dehydrogenase n=1 Tax=Aliiglaciecola sp. M165 TaxID=2593649 RepID=UPI00117D0E43|nr:iron-containing alcohol dehydrogenase [Aliiglaciecola sp. M165]TRY34087.1 iron-containing alcohol dehydrogenase [Aliiglaciecola sp. M165]